VAPVAVPETKTFPMTDWELEEVAFPNICDEFVRGEGPRMTLDFVLIVCLYVRALDTVVSPHCSRQ